MCYLFILFRTVTLYLPVHQLLQARYLLGNLLGGAGVGVAEGGKGGGEGIELLAGGGGVAALELLAHEADLFCQLDALDEAFPLRRGAGAGIDDVGVAGSEELEAGVVERVVGPVHPRPMQIAVEAVGNGVQLVLTMPRS